jgi:hypothetical protein
MKNGPYILLLAPKGYPGKRYRSQYAYEHHIVWWENTGETISFGEAIHHIDGNKHNNAFTNLNKLTSSEHAKLHGSCKKKNIKLKCCWCNKQFERRGNLVRAKQKLGQVNFFCCRSHQVSYQHKYKSQRTLKPKGRTVN